MRNQLFGYTNRGIAGDGKANCFCFTGLGHNGHVDTDHFALTIQQYRTTVAPIIACIR
jgi:hypothetical protein